MLQRRLILLLLSGLPLLSFAESSLQDRAGLTPADVVRIQLEALQANDEQNSGIAVVWEYTSPRNRAANGPYERFVQMIRTGYADMLNSQAIEVGETQVLMDGASVPVRLICSAGNPHGYIFWLSIAHPDASDGHWRTEGVSEVPLPETEDAVPATQEPARPQAI